MLLEITLAIIFAKVLNFIFEKIKQPGVLGEILAGIILGPCCIGLLSGSSITIFNTPLFAFNLDLTSSEFKEIAFIGVVFLLFIVGLETNMTDLKKTKKAGISAGIFGVIIPFLVGCLVGMMFHMTIIQCMALGTIFLATSVTIAIRFLADADMLATRVGLTLHTAVVLNDVLAMIIFALVFGNGGSFSFLIQILLFFVFTIAVGLLIARYYMKKNITRKAPILILTTGLVICFFFAAFAENMGVTAIIGAFIAGLFIRKTPQSNILADYIKTIGYAFFIPLFFVWVGASFNILFLLQVTQIDTLLFFIIIFVIFGLLGNFLGGSIGARISGMKRKEAISVGIGMMPVMGVALIIVTTGIDKGIFGDATGVLANQIKIATLVLIITSCFITPPLLKRSMTSPLLKLIGKTKTKPSFYHHPHCHECFSALRLEPTTNRWYCDTCQDYREIRKKTLFPALEREEKTDRYMKYVIGVGTILLCVYVIQSSAEMGVFEKISAIIGIFLGTTLAFFTIKYLFSNKKPSLK